jgi:peptidoglycan glycosyltransferase
VNTQISRLFVVTLVLFAALVGMTSWWTVVRAEELNDDYTAQNKRDVLRGLKVRRGAIRAADGTVLARSVRNDEGIYSRRYPQEGLFAHAVGYSYASILQTGLEASYNDELAGERSDASTLVDELRGRDTEGRDLRTTLDPKAQRTAIEALGGRPGAVVALDPKTGAVKVMASVPSFDPGSFRREGVFSRLATQEGSPLLNRTTQSGYVPGSTFKVVTAIAAIDSGEYTPDSRVDGANGKEISGVPLNNFGNAEYGEITLTEALTKSVNTVWAQVGEDLGKRTMQRYMNRLGFGDPVEIDLPRNERATSGEFIGGRFVPATNPNVDVGRLAIGQDKLRVTPLQMAMVASAVANGGVLMKPRMGDRVVDRDGRTTERIEPEELRRVMSEEAARAVTGMMTNVVREGSGTAAALAGIDVAGKTGTAERNIEQRINQPWFIGFAPAGDPEVVVAVSIESSIGGTGGEVAAPIAKQVMEALL